MYIAALLTIIKTWKHLNVHQQIKWTKKMWYVYTVEYYSVIKKKQNNAICSNMDATRDYHTT